jgi:hypothetical protein
MYRHSVWAEHMSEMQRRIETRLVPGSAQLASLGQTGRRVGNDPGRFRLTGNPHLTRRWPLGRAYQAAFSLVYRVGIENEKIDKYPASGIRRKTENNARVRFPYQ